MRRRWPAGLTALLLCLLLCAAAAGQGTQEPFLPAEQDGRWRLVVDDQVTYQNGRSLPEAINRTLYFPLEAVLPYLGCSHSFDVSSRTLSIYRGEHILSFNIDTGQVLTSDGRSLYGWAFYLSGYFYAPPELLLREFGGALRLLENDTYRLTTGAERLNDAEIVALMGSMPAFRPTLLDPAPIHLLLRGSGVAFDRMLRTLEGHGLRGAFFFSADDIAANPDRVRRLYVSGHTIGIYAAGGLEEAERANALLMQLIKTKTALVFKTGDTGALSAAGYLCWGRNLDAAALSEGVSAANIASRAGWRLSIYFNGSSAAADALADLLGGLPAGSGRVVPVTEVGRAHR
ncbi:MAG: hypothetical protein GXX99_07475 [Clostridiales bacterium]|nr:hypothetical protein [Clostridiales bacterium]